jgi:hypothetical protein
MGNYKATLDWRDRTKARLREAFGGSCCICGYDKCDKALSFHHLDPSEKEFGISARIKKWEVLVKEAKKCIMVCQNCHSEIHAGFTEVPEDVRRFNEDFTEYKQPMTKNCIECGIEITHKARRCFKCDNIRKRKVPRPSYEQLMKDTSEMSMCAVGRKYEVTDNAIRKWIKKYEETK